MASGRSTWARLCHSAGHVVANVIDRHQHHDGPTQSIHRLNARRRFRLSENRGSSRDFAILSFVPARGCRFLEKPPPVGVRIQRQRTRRIHSGGGVLAPKPVSPAVSSANRTAIPIALKSVPQSGREEGRTAESPCIPETPISSGQFQALTFFHRWGNIAVTRIILPTFW